MAGFLGEAVATSAHCHHQRCCESPGGTWVLGEPGSRRAFAALAAACSEPLTLKGTKSPKGSLQISILQQLPPQGGEWLARRKA